MDEDPFDAVLDLEDNYYKEGYEAGVADGAQAGRIEGRVFGLEKGFEKFVAMGLLHGKATVWASRLPQKKEQRDLNSRAAVDGNTDQVKPSCKTTEIGPLANNPRLEKHIQTLYALVEPETFSAENNEDAVADFDDRLKRAGAKAKVIERLIGESDSVTPSTEASSSMTVKNTRQIQVARNERTTDNMEDFSDKRFLA